MSVPPTSEKGKRLVTREQLLDGYRYHSGYNKDGSPRILRGEYRVIVRYPDGTALVHDPATDYA